MIDEMRELAQRIAGLPGIRTELTTFPSGAAMLDVWRDSRLFVMAYTPTWKGFGVDEVLDTEGFLEKYDFFSEDFRAAAEHLWKIIQEAPSASAGEPLPGGVNGQLPGSKSGPRIETGRQQP